MPEVVYTEGAGSSVFDLAVQESENSLSGCTVIDLKDCKKVVPN